MLGFLNRDLSRFVCILMFLSGASSLIVETILFRLLSYTFGNTAYAASTVLAVFMGGLAIGSAIFGKWCARKPKSLKVYGILELIVAIYSLVLPLCVSHATQLYVLVCHALNLQVGRLLPVQIAFGAVVAGIPAVFMGGTLPAVAHFLTASNDRQFEITIDKVYAANTFGAATGTILAAYVFVPSVGIQGALLVAGAIGFLIFTTVFLVTPQQMRDPVPAQSDQPSAMAGNLAAYLPFAFLSGGITLGFEVVWNHALGFLIGNTVYSFALMLFCILIGLAWGSRLVARNFGSPERWRPALIGAQCVTGVVVLVSLPAWQYIPSLFSHPTLAVRIAIVTIALARLTWIAIERRGSYDQGNWFRRNEALVLSLTTVAIFILLGIAQQSEATAVLLGDMLRFICACGVLIVPSVLLGISFPLLLNLCSQGGEKSSRIRDSYTA